MSHCFYCFGTKCIKTWTLCSARALLKLHACALKRARERDKVRLFTKRQASKKQWQHLYARCKEKCKISLSTKSCSRTAEKKILPNTCKRWMVMAVTESAGTVRELQKQGLHSWWKKPMRDDWNVTIIFKNWIRIIQMLSDYFNNSVVITG